ncbi:MAG: hypothetical protein KU28_10680 [Sulfurovum sp. PC08-66]|nr:MAG: hypothetical protein KU28_10680 [Sulfurovum sp. PC08-66]
MGWADTKVIKIRLNKTLFQKGISALVGFKKLLSSEMYNIKIFFMKEPTLFKTFTINSLFLLSLGFLQALI